MRLTLAGGLMLLAGAALAQDAPPVAEDFVALFTSYCLQKFPDDGALAAQAVSDKLEAQSPAQVKTIEGKPDGMGWMVTRAGVPYLLTIEQSSLHSCVLRRASDTVLDGAPLIAAAKRFVEAGGHKLMPPVAFAWPMAGGLVSNSITLQELDENDKPLPRAYMFFVVSHPPALRADGSLAKAFYEIRFMRQIYRQQT